MSANLRSDSKFKQAIQSMIRIPLTIPTAEQPKTGLYPNMRDKTFRAVVFVAYAKLSLTLFFKLFFVVTIYCVLCGEVG